MAAEHFTFSLLGVRSGEDGKQILAAIHPYTTTSCLEKQGAILGSIRPAFVGLSVVIEGAKQSGPSTIDVEFGGADDFTQYAIYGLVKNYQAKMRVGLLDTAGSWRVAIARILDTTRSKPACS